MSENNTQRKQKFYISDGFEKKLNDCKTNYVQPVRPQKFYEQIMNNISTEASKNSTKKVVHNLFVSDQENKQIKLENQSEKEEGEDSGRLFTFMNSTKDFSQFQSSSKDEQKHNNLQKKIEEARVKREKILSQILIQNKIFDIKLDDQPSQKSPINRVSVGNARIGEIYCKTPLNNLNRGLKNKSLTPKNLPRNRSMNKMNKSTIQHKEGILNKGRSSLKQEIVKNLSQKQINQKKYRKILNNEKNFKQKYEISIPNTCRHKKISNYESKKCFDKKNLPFFSKPQSSHKNKENDSSSYLQKIDQSALLKKKQALEKQLLSINQSLLLRKKGNGPLEEKKVHKLKNTQSSRKKIKTKNMG